MQKRLTSEDWQMAETFKEGLPANNQTMQTKIHNIGLASNIALLGALITEWTMYSDIAFIIKREKIS